MMAAAGCAVPTPMQELDIDRRRLPRKEAWDRKAENENHTSRFWSSVAITIWCWSRGCLENWQSDLLPNHSPGHADGLGAQHQPIISFADLIDQKYTSAKPGTHIRSHYLHFQVIA